jgi:hypothetical protein
MILRLGATCALAILALLGIACAIPVEARAARDDAGRTIPLPVAPEAPHNAAGDPIPLPIVPAMPPADATPAHPEPASPWPWALLSAAASALGIGGPLIARTARLARALRATADYADQVEDSRGDPERIEMAKRQAAVRQDREGVRRLIAEQRGRG